MDLTKILSISGKPGLFLMVGDAKNKIIVESLMDGKRYPAFSHDKISSLKEISIYTETDDLPLDEVFRNLFKAMDGKAIPNPKKMASNDLKSLFEKAVPEYDKDSVYVSNMKSVFNWYNILVEKDLIDMDVPEENNEAETKAEDTSTNDSKEETSKEK